MPDQFSSSIPKTQKACQFEKNGGLIEIKELPVKQKDELKPGEALVNVLYSGVGHAFIP